MGKLAWDQVGERIYETGVDRGVVYPLTEDGKYENGEAWNGLIGVEEKPSGAEASPVYANNGKYLNLVSKEDWAATVKAFTYPDAFAACNGEVEIAPGVFIGQQTRTPFGMSYRSLIGNDVKNTDYGYAIHLVYGCMAAPSQKSRNTVNESPEATEFSWEITTTPVDVPNRKPTAHVEIKSTTATKEQMTALETVLYGAESTPARLPLPAELIEIFNSAQAAG